MLAESKHGTNVMRAALFDMDRTLIRKDTASLYTRYRRDRGEATARDAFRVGWWMLQYTLGVMNAERVAERALRSFRGRAEASLIEEGKACFRHYILSHLSQAARDAVEHHRERGELLVIVTGAAKYVAQPLAEELGMDHVVCSELGVDEVGAFTGEVMRPLCYGAGKIDLTRRLAEQEDFRIEEATFYSDSITDLPLLECVEHPVAVNPDRRLRWIAQKHGWPVKAW